VLFCSHNEVDLEPTIIVKPDSNGTDVSWAVVRCTCCKKIIGKRHRLIDLIDKAVASRRNKT